MRPRLSPTDAYPIPPRGQRALPGVIRRPRAGRKSGLGRERPMLAADLLASPRSQSPSLRGPRGLRFTNPAKAASFSPKLNERKTRLMRGADCAYPRTTRSRRCPLRPITATRSPPDRLRPLGRSAALLDQDRSGRARPIDEPAGKNVQAGPGHSNCQSWCVIP